MAAMKTIMRNSNGAQHNRVCDVRRMASGSVAKSSWLKLHLGVMSVMAALAWRKTKLVVSTAWPSANQYRSTTPIAQNSNANI